MSQYGTAWIDVRGNTAPLGVDIAKATSKGANMFAGTAKTVLGDLGRTTTQLATGFVTLGSVGAASLVKVGASYNTLEQSSLAAFKTLLGTKEAAVEMQADLREFGKTSPFPRQAFIEGTQKLLSFGLEAKKVIPTLDGIQNAVAAAGGSSSDLTGIVDVLAKVRSSAAFTTADLNQLGDRGVNAAKLIGEQTGMSETEFRDSLFGAPLRGAKAMEALDSLVAGMSETYAGAAEGLKGTWVGAADRIKGAWRDIGSGIMDPFITKTGGGAAVDSANEIADSLRLIEKNILPVIVPLTEAMGAGLLKAATAAEGMTRKITPVGAANEFNKIIDVVDATRDSLKGLGGVATGVGISIAGIAGRSVLGPLGFLLPAISPITGALAGLVLGSDEGRDALKRLGEQAGGFAAGAGRDLVKGVGRLTTELSGPFSRVLEATGKGLLDAAEGVIPAVVSAFDSLGPPLARLIDAGGELITKVLPPLGSLLGGGISASLPILSVGLGLAADAAGLLADNAWILVPALGAIAVSKVAGVVGAIGTAFSTATTAASGMASAIGQIAATKGVSNMTAGLGVAKTSAAGLGTTLLGSLNPAVLGVTAALVVGGGAFMAWKKNQDQVRESAEALSDELVRQGEDVIPAMVAAYQEILDVNKLHEPAFLKTGWSEKSVAEMVAGNPGDWDKARQIFNDYSHSVETLAGHLDELPASVRPAWQELVRMKEEGIITGQDFINIINGVYDLDEAAVLATKNLKSMGGAFERAAEGTKLSAEAQRDLNTVLTSDNIEEQRAALVRLGDTYPEVNDDAGIMLGGQDDLKEKVTAAALSVDDASAMLEKYGTAAGEAGTASEDAADDVALTRENVDGLAVSVEEAKEQVQALREELFKLSGASRDAAQAQIGAVGAVDDIYSTAAKNREAVEQATQRVAEAERALSDARAKGDDPDGVASAERSLEDARKAQREAIAAASQTFDINTEAGRKNREQVGGVIESYEAWAKSIAMVDSTGQKTELIYAGLGEALMKFRADGIIPSDEAYQELLDTFQLTPSDMEIRVQLAKDEAQAALQELQVQLDEIPGGPQSDPLKAEIQALINQGDWEGANAKLLALPGVLDAEEAEVKAHAEEAGLETTEWQLNWLARERESWVKPEVDPERENWVEKRLDHLARDRPFSLLPRWMPASVDPYRREWVTAPRGGRAAGGPVTPGRWLVGEKGPEIVDIGASGHVWNAEQTQAMLDGKAMSGNQFSEAQVDRLVEALAERNMMDISVSADSANGRRIGLDVSDALWLRGH